MNYLGNSLMGILPICVREGQSIHVQLTDKQQLDLGLYLIRSAEELHYSAIDI